MCVAIGLVYGMNGSQVLSKLNYDVGRQLGSIRLPKNDIWSIIERVLTDWFYRKKCNS